MFHGPGPENTDPFSSMLPPRTPGSLGKSDAADPNARAHRGPTPGSLGLNDGAAHVAYGGGGGGGLAGMVLNLLLTASNPQPAKGDADDYPAMISQMNFACLEATDVHKKIADLAKSLGGQSHTNSVLSELGVGHRRGARRLKAIYRAAKAQQLDSRFIAAALFAEADWTQEKELDSFGFVGMDRFLKEYNAMLADGTLTTEMRTKFLRTSTDIHGETGEHYKHQAKFRTIEDQIGAFAGLLKHRRKLMLADLAEVKISEKDLTPDELDYWTYIYYNAGSSPEAGDPKGQGKRHLIHDGVQKSGLAAVHIPSRVFQPPDETGDSRGNAQRVLMIKRLLEWAGMAEPSDPSSLKLKSLGKLIEKAMAGEKKRTTKI
jgi:hypothetical protein